VLLHGGQGRSPWRVGGWIWLAARARGLCARGALGWVYA
jgi:hypothetical protein